MNSCKSCGGRFTWTRQGNKWHAVNADGKNHWTSCPSGRLKKQLTGPDMVVGRTIVGERYKASCGLCTVPPWEECACADAMRATPSPGATGLPAQRSNCMRCASLAMTAEGTATARPFRWRCSKGQPLSDNGDGLVVAAIDCPQFEPWSAKVA